jgi:L-cysteine S-thiosulfotransferase
VPRALQPGPQRWIHPLAPNSRFPKARGLWWGPGAGPLAFLTAGTLLAFATTAAAQFADRPASQPAGPLSGTTFQSKATQALQADDGANPAMLWVEQGATLWSTPTGPQSKSCATCHGDATQSMRGAATRYPQVDAKTATLLNLEGRINRCRTTHQSAPALAYESRDQLSLTSYIALQSRGLPLAVTIDGPAASYFESGRVFFMTRQGQLNVSCAQCHDDNVGHKLRGDPISQGHPTGWPGYRLEWQSLGSLHRRLRACSLGVRAEILNYGSPDYVALELYLAWRSKDLPIEAPAVRR